MSSIPVVDPSSPLALSSSQLLVAVTALGLLIFLGVSCWLVVNIVRFHARPGQDEPFPYEGNVGLEIGWTVVPALILAVIFVFSAIGMAKAEPAAPAGRSPDLVVVAHQWWWEVHYPKTGAITANEIHMVTGQPVYVELQSADVIHDLWIPQLGDKMDVVPGQTNDMWLQASTPGVFLGTCSEYCGLEHAWMRVRAIAEPQAQFDAWQRQQLQPAAQPTTAEAAQGAKLFQQMTCVNCHTVAGTPAKGRVGPDLTHFASRQTLGAGVLDNTPQNVATWLRNPQTVKPGVNMPNFNLSEPQVQELTAYLETLK